MEVLRSEEDYSIKEKNMSKEYCYKFKSNFIKVKENNAYAHPLIEKFGFKPVQQEFENEVGLKSYYWAECWAKTITFDSSAVVAKWLKKNVENIYKNEKSRVEKEPEKGPSKWLEEIINSGYEFDEDGHLIENEAFLSGLNGQLCVMATGKMAGVLYINLSGCVEFYDSNTLISSAFEDIMQLESAGAIYKMALKLKERKKKRRKAAIKAKAVDEAAAVKVKMPDNLDEKKAKKAKKETRGTFIIKTKIGYYTAKNTYSSLKEKAETFVDFKLAKKVQKEIGGKIVKL